MASIRVDTGPTGKRNNFEGMATHLLPYDPVAKKRLTGTKRPAALANINADISALGSKSSIGNLGYTFGTTLHKNTQN